MLHALIGKIYFFSGMPGKQSDTLQVESFLLQFCPGSTPIRYNLTRLFISLVDKSAGGR